VQRSNLSAFEVLGDSLGEMDFLALLSDKSRQETDPSHYFAAARQIGQRLLPPDLLSTIKSLIIIPDGRLCYLPFEALLTAAHTGNFATAPYLLRSHTVQYAWSATLLTMTKDGQKSDNQGFLQIVPFAKTARNGLAPLPNSPHDKPEHLAALVLSGEQASAAAFLQNASSYNILHLSTHANAGGEGEAGIEFFDRTLTLPEVYAQRFHASLVSLSACETGTGQFATGEGVLSLARAFAYAGAQSLVASHWAVNERSTAQLFSAFYENLAKGSSKSAALRQAKLTYLSSNEMDARKAPYQWAAFTLTGADGPVEFGHPWGQHWLLWAGGLGLAVLGFWFLGKRKRVDKKSSTRG
ncbi:MAG: CHAT domain-containing protein, partial [Saprospiraceae bacterium]|nr:CHAT domain-containing protein [Saprospiraceae bacterium]